MPFIAVFHETFDVARLVLNWSAVLKGATQVWDCGLRVSVGITQILRDAKSSGAICSRTHEIGARFDARLGGPLMMGAAVLTFNSHIRSRWWMAPT